MYGIGLAEQRLQERYVPDLMIISVSLTSKVFHFMFRFGIWYMWSFLFIFYVMLTMVSQSVWQIIALLVSSKG